MFARRNHIRQKKDKPNEIIDSDYEELDSILNSPTSLMGSLNSSTTASSSDVVILPHPLFSTENNKPTEQSKPKITPSKQNFLNNLLQFRSITLPRHGRKGPNCIHYGM